MFSFLFVFFVFRVSFFSLLPTSYAKFNQLTPLRGVYKGPRRDDHMASTPLGSSELKKENCLAKVSSVRRAWDKQKSDKEKPKDFEHRHISTGISTLYGYSNREGYITGLGICRALGQAILPCCILCVFTPPLLCFLVLPVFILLVPVSFWVGACV